MLKIYKLRADHVLDFAAEELKKYLRMMMPDCGEISICYDPAAQDGFRLGLLEDFALPSEAVDPFLDDVIHVETDAKGGVLAGSNPRSVLFSVYRFLRENGCRWLYPGVDGEYIPLKDIGPVSYHKMADHRFRGHCNEGAESQQCMLDTIDFYAKLELNVYMIEFNNPRYYYNSYYNHVHNTRYRNPEPIPAEQVLQWKRLCEVEMAKRGLQFHDMGHGWTADPFGFSSEGGWAKSEVGISENKKYLALLNGKRDFRQGVPLNTNLCMSNPEARSIMADSVVEYAYLHQNVDYLHIWLADGSRNHCECEECQKKRPSDWYLDILNEIDEKLTKKGLDTRIVFIAYVDTLFSPLETKLNNPERFSLLYAPITRSYTASITEDTVIGEEAEYLRNSWPLPRGTAENAAFLKAWKKNFSGPSFSYEYHFWKHQYMDPGLMEISRRIYEDIRSLKVMGLDGYVEDGSQRSFFPHGFHIYIYAETLMNRDCDYEATLSDYFSHIYGEQWAEVRSYLDRVSTAFDFSYFQKEASADPEKGFYYNPAMEAKFRVVKELAAEGKKLVEKLRSTADRPKAVSFRLLELHTDYIVGIANFMTEKCLGHNYHAIELWKEFYLEFGRHEFEIERYYDHFLSAKSFHYMLRDPKAVVLQTGLE